MGHALCLQGWTNITGVASQVVTQHNTHWADVAGYDTVGIYVEVSQCTGQSATSTVLAIQTSPDPDENIFSYGDPVNKGIGGAQVGVYNFTSASPTIGLLPIQLVPRASLSRYVRWQLFIGTVATSIHFRIWLNLNQAGW